MRKVIFVLTAFMSISFWLFTSVEAEKGDHERGRKSRGVAPRGSGQVKRGNQPAVHRQQPAQKFEKPKAGQYSKPQIPGTKQLHVPRTDTRQGGQKIPIQGPRPQYRQELKPKAGQYFKPQIPGTKQLHVPPTNVKQGREKIPIEGPRRSYRQGLEHKPTQGQVQHFLNLPKSDVGRQPGSSLGRVGASALKGAAGAMALDHFVSGGRSPGVHDPVGHMPVKGAHAGKKFSHRSAQHIRDNYSVRYRNFFSKEWWARHPNLTRYYWHNHIWPHHPWNYWWRPATWIALSSWVVWNWGTPLYYDYGSNFYYDDGYVYLNDQRLCSAPEYYQQAVQIIDKAPEITNNEDQWMSLGVFALSPDASKASSMVLQLAVNKDGNIQGTYYNAENDTTKPVKGMVDKESQRAVWTFADKNKNAVIMETGIYNLTKDETGVLAHFGKNGTQEWLMVRLKEPIDGDQAAPNPAQ
ncbi:MAG: hypothetical protein M1511_06380 [Deltaproteobacteria bacterium]|nr:hypothetical protein [Deltaproteobacteria bacterium]